MIKLCIEPYCHNCLHFNAKSTTSVLHVSDGSYTVVDSIVKCENAEKCREIEKHIASRFDAKGEQKC